MFNIKIENPSKRLIAFIVAVFVVLVTVIVMAIPYDSVVKEMGIPLEDITLGHAVLLILYFNLTR